MTWDSRFSTAFTQPLLVTGARGEKPLTQPPFRVSPADVVITRMKPSKDGKAVIVRLFNAALEERSTSLDWGGAKPRTVRLSETSEKGGERISGPVKLPSCGLVTLRIEGR
jgi:alpha-mannosidase